jgi:hypothetical protein
MQRRDQSSDWNRSVRVETRTKAGMESSGAKRSMQRSWPVPDLRGKRQCYADARGVSDNLGTFVQYTRFSHLQDGFIGVPRRV